MLEFAGQARRVSIGGGLFADIVSTTDGAPSSEAVSDEPWQVAGIGDGLPIKVPDIRKLRDEADNTTTPGKSDDVEDLCSDSEF